MMVSLKQQSGVILVVALIVLLVMTGVGVTLISGSTLQERMAGNTRQLLLARANADAALREGEFMLSAMDTTGLGGFIDRFSDSSIAANKGLYTTLALGFAIEKSGGVKNPVPPALGELNDPVKWATNTDASRTVLSASSTSTTVGRFVIEFMGNAGVSHDPNVNDNRVDADPAYTFRITAIGYGANDNISSILQSVYTTGQGAQ